MANRGGGAMIHLLIALLVVLLLGSCGYDPRCLQGCPSDEIETETVYQTTEVTKTVVVQGQKGDRGEMGPRGFAGDPGHDGRAAEPCTVAGHADGLDVTCNGQTVGVFNGKDGANGLDATLPPGTIVDTINPCGPDVLDEVILVTADGTLIAHYSDGVRQHLTVLTPGAYRTTDGHACNFSVDDENNLTWED